MYSEGLFCCMYYNPCEIIVGAQASLPNFVGKTEQRQSQEEFNGRPQLLIS